MTEWIEYVLEYLLSYPQPKPYIAKSTDYSSNYKTPILTAGKSFISVYTKRNRGYKGIYERLSVIVFDDFATSTQHVNLPFKVISPEIKI